MVSSVALLLGAAVEQTEKSRDESRAAVLLLILEFPTPQARFA